jgi:hypothetical protein
MTLVRLGLIDQQEVASMNRGLTKLLMILAMSLGTVQNSVATTFYADDYETGIHYVGRSNAHPGGGYISFLGGEIVNGVVPGDGTQDFQRYTNVTRDGSTDARGAIAGSNYSLKTPYRAGYEDDFGLNTTIIEFPETNTVYIRWYQKWSANWIWPRDQQKLAKVKGPEQSQNFKVSWGFNFINVTKKSPPPNDGINETYVFANLAAVGESPGDFRQNDSDPATGNFPLDRNRWYCIEIMVKSNTPGASDGQLEYWIDDSMKFNLTNTINRGTSTRGITTVELQHVLQTGGAHNPIDTPTWMDNVVVADQRIGCNDSPKPMPPTINSTVQ